MQHLDEGLLMALLDGELVGSEQQDAEAHIRACPECAGRLEEMKDFMTEADGLVVALGEPPALEPTSQPASPVRTRLPISPRALAWAASIVAAIGLGFAGSTLMNSERLESSYSGRGMEQQDNAPTATNTPSAPPAAAAPAPSEMAVQEERARQPVEGGLTTGPGSADELGRPETDSSRRQLTNEALAVRPNSSGEAGQSGIISLEQDRADAAVARDTVGSMAEVAAKVSEREDQLQRSRADTRLAAPSASSAAGFRREAPAGPVFLRVTMEEAVQHLSGAIRLIDGLTPEEFEVSVVDSTPPIVRVHYRVGPTESVLLLDQQRADNSFVASDLQKLQSSVGRVTIGNRLAWNDLHGFVMTLSGPFSSDSLFHFKTLVK